MLLDKLPTTAYTVVRVVYTGDRENAESFYYSTEKAGYWYHMGDSGAVKPDWLLESQAKLIEFVAQLPHPIKRTPRETS